MKFGDVLEALKNGLPIRRNAWDEDIYTYYDFEKYKFIDLYKSGEYIESQDAPFGLGDLIADDWEIHEWDEKQEKQMTINDFKLCYFKNNFAYFTNDFENQTGDDWNDAPFDSNAGTPYDHKGTIVFKIALYGDFSSAQDDQYSRPTSVDDINKGFMPWIVNGWNSDTTWAILGGTSYLEFLKHCDQYKLNCYVCQKEINETINKIDQLDKQLQMNFEE